MKIMKVAPHKPPAVWLRTDHPVTPMNPEMWKYLPGLESALHQGVETTPDSNRPGFYEIQIGDNWYYVHLPSRLRAVYLVAARNRGTAAAKRSGLLEHQPAAC
jgi:hypothetical protein